MLRRAAAPVLRSAVFFAAPLVPRAARPPRPLPAMAADKAANGEPVKMALVRPPTARARTGWVGRGGRK